MIMKIWSKAADQIDGVEWEINSWIQDQENQGLVVVDQKMVSGAVCGSSFTQEPYVTITVWMDKEGISTKGLGRR